MLIFLFPFCNEDTNSQRLIKTFTQRYDWAVTRPKTPANAYLPSYCAHSLSLLTLTCPGRTGQAVGFISVGKVMEWPCYNNRMVSKPLKKAKELLSQASMSFSDHHFPLSFLRKALIELNIKTPGGKKSPGGKSVIYLCISCAWYNTWPRIGACHWLSRRKRGWISQ